MFITMTATFLFLALLTLAPTLVVFFGRIINNTKGPIPEVPVTSDNNKSSIDSAIASGNVLEAPSTISITVSELPAVRQAKGFRRTRDRGRIAAWDAPKASPYYPGRKVPPTWNKDFSTIDTPRWTAIQKQVPSPTPGYINSLTAAPTMVKEVTAQPYYTGPPKLEKLDTTIREDPIYTGPTTEEEIDAAFAEDDLDMDFSVMGMDIKMDWDAKSKSVSAYADLEAELSEGFNTTKKSIIEKPSILKKPGDCKEDTRTSDSRTLAWGEDQIQTIKHNWLNAGSDTRRGLRPPIPAHVVAYGKEWMAKFEEYRKLKGPFKR